MAETPSAELISGTQTSLGKFVKRPPLTEKLLKKPPFRFLHDIITSVLKSHGFFEGLFEEAELISENVKDREAKILFLTKVISVLSLTTGKSLTAKPAKIISGQEPEKTNELLLCLGLALEQNLSTEEAVTTYKNNLKTSQNNESTKKSHEESVNKPAPKSKQNGISTSKSREKLVKSKDKKELTVTKKDTNKRETSISKKDVEKKNRREPSISRHDTQKEKQETHKDEKRERSKDTDETLTKQRSREKVSKTSPPKPASTQKRISASNPKINAVDNQAVTLNRSSEFNKLNLVSSDSFEKQEGNIKPPGETKLMEPENNDYSEGNLLQNGAIWHNNNENNESVTPIDPPMKLMTENEIFHSVDNDSLSSSNHLQNNGSPTDKNDNDSTSAENVEVTQTEYSKPTKFHENTPMSAPKSNNYEIEIGNISDHGTEVSVQETNNEISTEESMPEGNKPSMPMEPTRRNVLRPPTARPPSARPGAPRLREKHDVLTPTDSVPMSKVNVIVENGDPDIDEDETSLVFVETAAEQQTSGDSEPNVAIHHSFADHGHLVQQILDSQKEFSQMQTGKTEIEWEFGAQRAREASSLEVEQLRFNLQALSRAANPLGKLLDHIQEDVEVMRQELQQWTNTYDDATAELTKQKSDTERALQPLQAKNKQLDEEIMDKRDKINDLKSIIYKNSTRINKLLASGNVQ